MSYTCDRTLLALCALASMVFPLIAAPLTKPSEREVARWIKELGDNDFAVREKASRQLWLAGQAAEAALEKALQDSDAEVVRRARAILDKFRWGIYPDTPANVIALIRAYHSSTGDARQQTLEKLLQSDPAGLHAILKFAETEKRAGQREALRERVSRKLLAAFQRLGGRDEDLKRFDAFIAFAYERNCVPDNHYVAYWLLRGKLDEHIAHFRARSANNPSQRRFAETLAYLHRAKGNWKEAHTAAKAAKRDSLIHDLLVEAADWKTLAARPEAAYSGSPREKGAYRAAFARLAGKRKDFDAAIEELLKQTKKERNYFTTLQVARTLLLNDRPAEALALLAESPDHQTELFDIFCARQQYREALALADRPRPVGSNEQQYLNLLKARTLYQLGEKDRARALFVHYGEQIKEGVNGFWAERLIAEEYEIGLKDLAFEHCARAKSIEVNRGDVSPAWRQSVYLRQVFPDRSDSAGIWWELLRQRFPDDTPKSTMKRLRDLLEGKTEARAIKQWIEEVQRGGMRARLEGGKRPASSPPLSAGDPHWQALVDAALANGLDELASSLLEKADTSEALIHLGDMLADKDQWTRASERYRQAWWKSLTKVDPFTQEEHGNPLPLFLTGFALVKAGRRADGDRLIEQSHQALLGHSMGRHAFLKALEERGHISAARREADLLSRVSEPNSYYSGAAWRRLGKVAANRNDYLKAAECYEQSKLRFLRSTAYYNQIGSYISVPALIHRLRATGLLAAGKHQEACRHIELALTICPGNANVAAALVPALERCGRKKDADALFDRCAEPHEKTCRDYPRCAESHNSLAWMSACCRRNLDTALQHARKAVELAPTHANYLDTLAEVHFQRGEKDKAIAAVKRAIELAPKKSYYRKQLKRLEAGDPSAERPPENED